MQGQEQQGLARPARACTVADAHLQGTLRMVLSLPWLISLWAEAVQCSVAQHGVCAEKGQGLARHAQGTRQLLGLQGGHATAVQPISERRKGLKLPHPVMAQESRASNSVPAACFCRAMP